MKRLFFLFITPTLFWGISPQKMVQLIDSKFYYPQKTKIHGFKMRIYYTGAENFINTKIDPAAGEKKGKIYVIYRKDKGRLEFDVSRIAKRLQNAVRLILQEQQELILPRTLSDTLKNYKLKTHKEGRFTKLYAYVPKGTRAPIIRVEYFVDKNFKVHRTHAYLHTGEQIDSKWDLIKNRYGKYMIKKNTIVLSLMKGRVAQQVIYTYRPFRGVYLPTSIILKSRFENGQTRVDRMEFSEHEVF